MENVTLTKTGERAILMEPKDLRIGNILSYDGKYVHITHISLDIDDEYQDTIGFCYINKTTGEICDWNRALCDKLYPVLLTPEILNQLGFSQIGKWWELKTSALSPNPINISLIYNKTTFGQNEEYEIKHINHVHELQNIYFAFTGEEFILNLSLPNSDIQQLQKP